MLEIALLAGARDDLDESYNWYESKETGLGDRFLNYVQDGFLLIRQHPEIFPVLTSNFRRALISKFPFEIIYKIEGKRVLYIPCLIVRKTHRSGNLVSRSGETNNASS